jgi:hypothetical protein
LLRDRLLHQGYASRVGLPVGRQIWTHRASTKLFGDHVNVGGSNETHGTRWSHGTGVMLELCHVTFAAQRIENGEIPSRAARTIADVSRNDQRQRRHRKQRNLSTDGDSFCE